MAKDKIEIGISLNNTCNLRCKMCRIWNQDDSENRLTLDTALQIIDELERFEVKGVRLSGGDPLLVPWALELASYISKKKYHSVATTNGSMINRVLARKIIDSGISNLNISLDAFSPEVHDAIRGLAGSHQKIMQAIEYLAQDNNGPTIGINTVISNLNLDEIIPLTEMIQLNARIDHIYFMAVMQPFGSPTNQEWFLSQEYRSLWPQDKSKVKTVIEKLISMKKSGYRINNGFAQLKTFIDYFIDPLHFTKRNTCNLGKEVVEVNQLGDVYLCYNFESIGNIFTDTLFNIWKSRQSQVVRGKINRCNQNCNLLINCYFEEEDV